MQTSKREVKFILAPSTLYDVLELYKYMRESDRNELAYAIQTTGTDIYSQMITSCISDNYVTMWANDRVVAVGGINAVPDNSSIGIIWLLGTNLADKYWRQMTRLCQKFIETEKPNWEGFGNIVPTSSCKRIKWLQHLGFDILDLKAQIDFKGYVKFYMNTSYTAPKTQGGSE